MVDTRPKALEKARKRAAELKAQRDALQENTPVQAERPPGGNFESERQKAKSALRSEIDAYDGTGVHKISADADKQQEERMLLNGSTTEEIAETLTDLERETGGRRRSDGRPNTRWTATGVANFMRNERYCGDVLARKTWTPDFHDHKSVKNRNKKNKYYQPAHHDAIITRAQWNAAQRILNSHRYRHTGTYVPMRVIDHGALRGYISINRAWAGYEADEYYRISRIAMGLDEGELRADLENEHLPDAGHRIAGMTDDNGILRISRELSDMEKRMKAQLEGKTPEEYEQENAPPVKKGFQVVGASMFSQAFEPVVRLQHSSISFNATCISKLNTMTANEGGPILQRCQHVELLFNPVERMLAVRPCAKEHPNAIRWAKDNGTSTKLGAKAFCSILFDMLNWDESFAFRVPAMLRTRGNEKILFFDLDNYIGHATAAANDAPTETQPEIIEPEQEEENLQGFFYAADEDEAAEIIEDQEDIERRVQERIEQEKRSYGTPAFEHSGGSRIPMIDDDGEWDIMAEAVVLDIDHTVEAEAIEQLQDTMLEALYVPTEDPEEDGDNE